MARQHNKFLGELLMTLFDRRRAQAPGDDRRYIDQMCRELLSAAGEVSGLKLVSAVLARYRSLDRDRKIAFFSFLSGELDIDATAVSELAQAYAKDSSPRAFAALQEASELRRQELFRRLNQPPGATAELVAMRVDLLELLPEYAHFGRIDWDFVHLLRSWFNRGFLVLRQISWETSATILERIVAYEAVHEICDWEDLRRRLHPPDRRCFAFFHPTMPDEPLIFVEVALTSAIPSTIGELLSQDREPLTAESTTTAVFYSISNCQRGLQGISFGNLLIKQVVDELSQEFPQLRTFVTLSPLPRFNRWLESLADHLGARRVLAGGAKAAEVREMAAHYLLKAKRADGRPFDPVARFHLGNGAIVHDIHAGADQIAKGLRQSGGIMVNYLYDLTRTETNHEAFVSEK